MTEITFATRYTAADRNEFDRLVLAVDRLLSNIKSAARRNRTLHVEANFGKSGIVCVHLWELNYSLRDAEHAIAFEGVDYITDTDREKSIVTLQIGSEKYRITLSP